MIQLPLSLKFHIRKRIWLGGLALLLTLTLFFGALFSFGRAQLCWGLTLGNLKLGGLTPEQAKALLTEQTSNFAKQKLTFVFEQKTWQLTPQELGLKIDAEQTLAAAADFGRGNGNIRTLLAAQAEQLGALTLGQALLPTYSLDAAQFKKSLEPIAAVEQEAINAGLKYNTQTGSLEITPSKDGLVFNRSQLLNYVVQNFGQPNSQTIYLTLEPAKPQLTKSEIEAVKPEAEKLIAAAPFFLQSNEATWKVSQQDLADWIGADQNATGQAQLNLNAQEIKDFLTPLASNINRQPVNAKLGWANGEINFVLMPQPGQRLNLDSSAQKITNEILATPTGSSNKKNIYLVIDEIKPLVDDASIKELGLTSMLAKGESNFAGSPKNRQLNIKNGAAKLNGLLIKPGEEFSFAQNIGDINEANGWVQELVIKNNQTIPEFGGGLCQISTTLFRAAINAGLKITERHPHAYPVHYYDPPGFDATVYPPKPDLKFINDTPNNILLQSKISGTKLYFEIYGTSDGRQVKIKGPTITQKNPDGSLKAILTQEIWRDGQKTAENIFRSAYKSADLFPIVTASPTPTP